MSAKERERQKRIKNDVISRDGLICCYCNKVLDENTCTLEHIVPNSKRGTFNSTNLTIACYVCNNSRGNKPFFDYIKKFDFSEEKVFKYKKMYINNLKIKILNIAKEECLKEDMAVPNILIRQACSILKIKPIDFSNYLNLLNIKLDEQCTRRDIKFHFENLIKFIENEK